MIDHVHGDPDDPCLEECHAAGRGVPPDRPRTGPLTAASLYRRRWYVVPDDEVGGWAVATVSRPASAIDPTASRDRVLAWFVWEEHARWLVTAHNEAYAADPPDGRVPPHPDHPVDLPSGDYRLTVEEVPGADQARPPTTTSAVREATVPDAGGGAPRAAVPAADPTGVRRPPVRSTQPADVAPDQPLTSADDDRSRYVVLAAPWYDHGPGDGGHDGDACAAGYELLVLAPRTGRIGDPWNVLGVTQDAAPLDLEAARETALTWLRLRADSRSSSATGADVDVYRRVT